MKTTIFLILFSVFALAQQNGWENLPAYGAPNWKDSVVNAAALPVNGNTISDVRVAEDTGVLYEWNGASWQSGTGTVTSVGLALPGSVFNVTGSPVTGSGTLTGSFINQSANSIFAGPASGPAAAPAFRSLVLADLPPIDASNVSYTPATSGDWSSIPSLVNAALDDLASSGIFKSQSQNLVLASPNGSSGVPSFRALVPGDIGSGSANTFAGFDNAGALESVPGFSISTVSGGMGINLTQHPNNGGGGTVMDHVFSFDPLQNSPNENWNIYNLSVNFDINNSGFSQGTSGNAVQLLNLGFTNTNTGPIGQVVFENLTGNFGNGTDPLTTNGLIASATGIQYAANVTLNNQLQGYSFSPSVNAAAISGTGFGVQAFSDASQIGIASNTYFSANFSPNIAEILNNASYTGVTVNPNIPLLSGNAGATGFSFNGQFASTSATNGVAGVQMNPTITTMGASGFYHGVDIFGNIATSHGNVQGININTNVNGGDANFTGINVNPGGTATLPQVQGINVNLSNLASTQMKVGLTTQDAAIGVNALYDTSIYPASPGFLQINGIGGEYHVAAGFPVSNTLVFGDNLGVASLFEDNMGPDPFGGFIGYSSVGFLSQLAVATGKTVDTFTSLLAASSVPGIAVSGGTITNANVITVVGPLNQGGTLNITNLKGINIPSGLFNSYSATNAWGVYVADTSVDNWFAKDVVIGGATGKPVGSESLSVTGTSYLNGALDMVTHQIHNVVDPSSAQDAATKNYVDTAVFSSKRYIDFLNGNDSGSGSGISPWKTVQHACTALTGVATINSPYTIFITGGNNDSDASPITCPPNITLIGDYPIQISQPFTVTGGSTNDSVGWTNIIFVGAVNWTRNDNSQIGVAINNTQFFSGPTLKQQGAGAMTITAVNSVFVNADFLLPNFGSFFTQCTFLGTSTTFEDVSSASYFEFSGGYSGSNMTFNGGEQAYFSGFIHDAPFGAALTANTTGNGTPILQIDSAGAPALITGSPTFIYQSLAQYVAYSPAVSGNWTVAPGLVSQALDDIAATGITKVAMTNGGVLWTNGSQVQNVGAGTSGQFLKSNGAAAPTWASTGGGGGSGVLCDLSVGPAETYTTISSAIAASSPGNSICIQGGTYAESPVVSSQLNIYGSGRAVEITGSLTFASGADFSLMQQFKVDGGVSINSGVTGVQLLTFWNATGQIVNDQGIGSYIVGMQE